MKEKYQELRKRGKLHGTIKRAVGLAKDREARKKEADRIAWRKRSESTTSRMLRPIPFGPKTIAELQQRGERLRSRVRNWTAPQPCLDKIDFEVEKWQDGFYRGGSRMHPLYRYTVKLRCCGAVSPGQIVWFFDDQTRKLHAPQGWRFGRDREGLFLERNSNKAKIYRYHFTNEDLASKSTLRAAAIEHELKQQVKNRQIKGRKTKEKRAMRLGVLVMAQDSYASGNCYAGTATWARKAGLNTRRFYPVKVIERLAKGDLRVLRTIDAAIDRSIADLDRGYCICNK